MMMMMLVSCYILHSQSLKKLVLRQVLGIVIGILL